MKRFWRVIKWSVLGLGLLVSLVIVALAIYVRTENFTHWAREQAVAAINDSIRGSIAVERLEASMGGNLTLYNATLRYQDDEIIAVPRLQIAFSWWPLIWGRYQLARIDAMQPRARLTQHEDGRWNVVEALAPRRPEPESPSELIVLVDSLQIRNGDVALLPAGAKLYHLKDFNVDGDIRVRPTGLVASARDVTTLLAAKGQPELRLKGGLAYQKSGSSPGLLSVKDLWAVSHHSRVKIDGQLAHANTLKVTARAALQKLAASDIAYFVHDWPIKQDLAGEVAIEGPLEALTGNVALAAAGAKLAGNFHADVAAELPRYSATLVLSGFDLRRWLDNKNFAGVVDGTAEATGRGYALPAIAAKARFAVRGAEVQGWSLGSISLDTRLENSVAAVTGQLKSKLGGASWSGEIALKDKPAYDLKLAVKDLDIQKAVPEAGTLEGRLNLQGTVKGAGLRLAEMNTRADIQVLPSKLGPVDVKQGVVNAMLSEKRLRIARAAVSTAESTITVAGELGLEAKITGKLDYRVGVADVSPWLSLIDRKGSGSVNLTGQARGNLADLRTEGSARMSGLRLDGVLLRDGNVKFALQGSQGHWFPAGVVTARLAGVDAGLSLRRIDATAKLARQPSPSIEISLAAQDLQERKHALNGTVGIAADAITLRLSQAALASPVGTWTLAQAATITKRDQDFFIERLSLRNGEREVSLDGRFGFTGKQDLTLSVERFSLETLAAFFPQQPKMTGLLGAQARITGSAAAPEMTALARLSDASIAGQAYAGASADLQYKDKRASLRLVVQQDATHALTGAGSLPLALSWQNGWRAEPGDGMDFRIRSDGISLAFLNAFSDKSVANIAGEMSLDALARGSIKQPAIQGTFRLRDGRVKILPLGIEVTAIGAEGNLDSRNLVLREISARAKDGEIRGSGSLALNGYDVSAVKLSLKAQRWPAIETERYQVKLAGNVDVQGSLTAPQVTGNLTVTEGSLRPDLAFLDQSKVPLKRDETIVVIKNKQIVGESALQAAKSNTAADSGLLKNVTLDLNVRAPGNLWIRHPDMVAELSGNIQTKKTPQRELDLIGRIEIVRGWMGFQGRRFQLVRGAIEFTGGGKINPSLDIVAQYRVQDYVVEATVSGTTEKPALTLASQPRLEQADILALLIFGRPLNALNKEEQGSLQQSALSLTSGFVAAGIAKSVSQAIGLDSLGLDIGDVDFGGGRVGFGRYVGSGTYVSASQQLSGEQGREVSAEYRITPDWKLSTSTTSTGSSGIDIIWHKRY